jgi:predicted negative regulator of RcsB-dependent stress response
MKNVIIKIAQNNTKTLIIGGIITIAGVWVGVAVFNNKRKKRDRLAIAFFSELQRDIAPDSVGLVESNAFDIRYWENIGKKIKKPIYMLTVASSKSYAKDIRDSWGVFDDDEAKIKSVFRAMKDQVQVSQIAFQYYNDPKGDKINLIDDLKSRLSKDEVGEVLEIVKKLPQYRLAEPQKK